MRKKLGWAMVILGLAAIIGGVVLLLSLKGVGNTTGLLLQQANTADVTQA